MRGWTERYHNVYQRGYTAACEDLTNELRRFLEEGGQIAAGTETFGSPLGLRSADKQAIVSVETLNPAAFDFLRRMKP